MVFTISAHELCQMTYINRTKNNSKKKRGNRQKNETTTDKAPTVVGSTEEKSPHMASVVDKLTPPHTSEPYRPSRSCSPCKYRIFGCQESKTLPNSSALGFFNV